MAMDEQKSSNKDVAVFQAVCMLAPGAMPALIHPKKPSNLEPGDHDGLIRTVGGFLASKRQVTEVTVTRVRPRRSISGKPVNL